MRRWLLIVMIVLLPLRGWIGEAMAGEMLQQHAPAATAAQLPAPTHGHDCDEHRDGMVQPQDAQPQAGGDCPTCASCQVCSAVALWPPIVAVSLARLELAPPVGGEPAWTPAEPVLPFKPPRN
jgi:hypothetical protein